MNDGRPIESFRVLVHPAVEGLAPEPSRLEPLRAAFPYPEVEIRYWPRSMADSVLGKASEPYSFRAFTRGNVVNVFLDPTETHESATWITGHELGHVRVKKTPGLREILREAAPADVDPRSDRYHEVDPEERYADGLATRVLRVRLDRAWWRDRAMAMIGGRGRS